MSEWERLSNEKNICLDKSSLNLLKMCQDKGIEVNQPTTKEELVYKCCIYPNWVYSSRHGWDEPKGKGQGGNGIFYKHVATEHSIWVGEIYDQDDFYYAVFAMRSGDREELDLYKKLVHSSGLDVTKREYIKLISGKAEMDRYFWKTLSETRGIVDKDEQWNRLEELSRL